MKNSNENHLSQAEEQFSGADGDFFAANARDGSENWGADGGEILATNQPDFQRTFTLEIANGGAAGGSHLFDLINLL